MAQVAEMLGRLDRRRLPVHVTPVVRDMVEAMARRCPAPRRLLLRQLLRPALTDRLLDRLGDRARLLDPILHNTVSPTIVETTQQVQRDPERDQGDRSTGASCPASTPGGPDREVRAVVGDDVELEVLRHDPGPREPDMGLFATLGGILEQADPGSTAMPLLMPGVTDGRFFSRLGIQTYGFTPMRLPADFNFWQTVHARGRARPGGGGRVRRRRRPLGARAVRRGR